jgi:D-inositol-3-phosphate glycosyltransferase
MNVYVNETCRAFSDAGVETDVFTRRLDSNGSGQDKIAELSRIIELPAGPPEFDRYQLLEQVEGFAARIVDYARSQRIRYDMIYSHYWLSGAAACSLRPRWRIPWAHSAHTLAEVKNRSLAPGACPEPAVRAQLEGEIARAADLLVVSTPAESSDLARLYGTPAARLRVVEPGVDHVLFRPGPKAVALEQIGYAGHRILLFVGRLERLKGVEIAIRAVAMIAPRHPDLKLVVLGENGQDEGESEAMRLAGLARSLGVEDRVDFKGSVVHSELTAYYRAAEALLMPSYSESFGLVGLEAQACGCPVIASNVAGLASVVRSEATGYLIDGDSPKDYAERVERLLSDPALATELGRRGAQRSRRLTWDRTASRLLGAFADLALESQLRLQLSALQEYGNSPRPNCVS